MSNWRTEVLEPSTMSTEDIQAELRHEIDVYGRVQHSLSKAAVAGRITLLVDEMDRRAIPKSKES